MASKQTTNSLSLYNKLFEIVDPFNNRYYRGDIDLNEFNVQDSRDIFCGKDKPMKPITITYGMWGHKIADVIWTTLIGIGPVVSSELLTFIETNNFTGWSTYPVKVFSKSGEVVKGYSGLSIVGRCGPIDYTLSERVTRPAPYPGGEPHDEYVGMYFHPDSWDGSDLFCPEDMTCIFAVERVVKAFQKAQVKNLRYIKLTEQTMDVFAVK